jgi:hypothetical protein
VPVPTSRQPKKPYALSTVIAGLDPAIHPLMNNPSFGEEDGPAGQARG